MPENLFAAIDNYCERIGPELWSEPVNALTNLAFIAAGLFGVRLARRQGAGGFAELLGWWVVAIGLGSALFHTFANGLTVWADILPIAGFTFAYTLFALRNFLGFGWGGAIAVFAVFYLAAGVLTALVPDWLRVATAGSTGYLPAFLGLTCFGAWAAIRGNRGGHYTLAAAAIFVVSVTFRILDPRVCQSFPLGTHFLWHLLNGLMLGVLLAAAARHGKTPSPQGEG